MLVNTSGATNVGLTAVGSDKVVIPAGGVHKYVIGSKSGS